MSRSRFWAPAFFGLLLSSLASAAVEPPEVVVQPDGQLVVRRMPPILGGEDVRPHLDSGLTTTFQIEAGLAPRQGPKRRGAARVEVRYELWDEVYLTTVLDGAGARRELKFASLGDLETWWRGLSLALAPGPFPAAAGPWTARVELAVVPFSYAEQQDAQRWLSKSLAAASDPASGSATEPEPAGSPVLDLLLATSIRRQRVVAWQWSLPFAAR